MPKRGHKGRFVKGHTKALARTRTRTITKTRYRTRKAPKAKRARRGGRGGGGVNMMHLALASGAMGYITSQNGPAFVRDNVNKIPGAKTFGAPAAFGVACLAVDRFVKPNKWLRLAGYAGVVAAALKFGEQGTSFKWVGDDDVGDEFTGDVEGDEVDGDDVSDLEP